MSKRGSKNAIKFAGKSWGNSSRPLKVNKSKKQLKIERKRELRDNRRTEKFNLICKKFNLDESFKQTNTYERLLKTFLSFKGSKSVKSSLKNVPFFEAYCKINPVTFDINIYFTEKYNQLNFEKKYPELVKRTNAIGKTKEIKPSRNRNSIINLLSNETLQKLKDRFK